MRLRLLGLGRIGAFHAETLAGLPAVEELVISDPVPTWPNRLPIGLARGSPEAPRRC
jgi:myo-inositol 2-dehydrogenase / D-chiro-inositol 1-dehydrogenase